MKTERRDITPPGWSLATTQGKTRTFLQLGKIFPGFVVEIDAKGLFVNAPKETDTKPIYKAAVAAFREGDR